MPEETTSIQVNPELSFGGLAETRPGCPRPVANRRDRCLNSTQTREAGKKPSSADATTQNLRDFHATNRMIHPSWLALIELCLELGHGEIERLSIQDGLPVLAETVKKKVRFPR